MQLASAVDLLLYWLYFFRYVRTVTVKFVGPYSILAIDFIYIACFLRLLSLEVNVILERNNKAVWLLQCCSLQLCAAVADGERLERILQNDLILKHDSIWPHGLNVQLHLDSLIEVTEFRRSCLRHHWPPEYDTAAREQPELDLDLVRRVLAASTDKRNDGPTPTKKNTVVKSDSRDQSR